MSGRFAELCDPNWLRREQEGCNFAERLVRRIGEHSCLIDAATGREYSGQDLLNLIVGYAAGFLSSGLRAGDRILINCSLTSSSTLAYLGAMYAGIVPVPVEDRVFASSSDSLLARVDPKAVWTAREQSRDAVARQGILQIAGEFPPQDVSTLLPASCAEEDLAALMLTSGSTGTPRLVMISHGNLIANTEAIIRSQGLGTDERAMLIMPIAYCFGASVMHTHLYQGGGVVFDSRFIFPDKVLHAVNRYRCTTFAGVPAVYNVLLRRSNLKSIPMPRLRRFLQAGGALAPESVRQVRDIVPSARFMVMYGQTEATARISCWEADCASEKLGSAGLPLDNLELRIVDSERRDLTSGNIGEIEVRGPSISAGYLDDPESTAHNFAGGWLKTHDYGLRDADGYLWIKGRAADFIKIRGRRVSVSEIEAKVGSIPGVYECAAIPVQDEETGEAVALFVVPRDGNFGLVETVRSCLPPLWTCASISLVEEIPKTPNGKIARNQLRVAP
jgi:acyl-CoA synthetase (AMP-forming)/AMP-acid ligase II